MVYRINRKLFIMEGNPNENYGRGSSGDCFDEVTSGHICGGGGISFNQTSGLYRTGDEGQYKGVIKLFTAVVRSVTQLV